MKLNSIIKLAQLESKLFLYTCWYNCRILSKRNSYRVRSGLGVIHILRNHQGGGGGFGMITLM